MISQKAVFRNGATANTNAGIAAQRHQFGHPGPLLTATKDIDISEAAVVAKLVLS